MNARVLLLGSGGQVGRELRSTLLALGDVHAYNHAELDIADFDLLRERIRVLSPTLIVNAAAYTDVDGAERAPELALRSNAEAPGVLAEEARRLGALLVHFSTDYVFNGMKGTPYHEQDAVAPVNGYGRSKLAGEQAIGAVGARALILRTSWVYATRGRNFVLSMLRLAREREEIQMVDDQFGSPTWSAVLAVVTAQMLAHPAAHDGGLYHVAGGGRASRIDLARWVLQNRPPHVPMPALIAIPSSDYPLPARRPDDTSLDCTALQRAFGLCLPPWQRALERCLEELAEIGAP